MMLDPGFPNNLISCKILQEGLFKILEAIYRPLWSIMMDPSGDIPMD
jgi:hypothetical protein